jgi:hypothetical protein
MPRSLPSELWIIIASDLSTTNDLAHLGITCSRIFHIVRPFLYRNVVIEADGHQSNASHVLALLAHDKSLAKCVVQLTLKRIQPPGYVYDPQITPPSLINVDALTNMVSLQHVALYGFVFRNAHEQNELGRVLAGIPLAELTYVADDGAVIRDEGFPTDRIGDIGDLKKLYWDGGDSRCAFISLLTPVPCHIVVTLIDADVKPLWHLLSRSTSTIHTLTLPFDLCLDDNDNLWYMYFPHLRSFTLGSWENESEPPENDFWDFIVAHSDTIQVLDHAYEDDVTLDQDSWTRLPQDSLPHLHSLRGHLSMIETFAHARLHCLRTTLRRLAIGPGVMRRIFDALLCPQIGSGPAIGPLLALQEIELQLNVWDDGIDWNELVGIIQQCARCCPSLEGAPSWLQDRCEITWRAVWAI